MRGDDLQRNVFLYWEGEEFSLIRILRKIIQGFSNKGRGYEVFLLNDGNVGNFIEVPSGYNRLSLPHKADYVRVAVIKKFGGIWLDSDTLVLSDLSLLFEFVDKTGAFFILENNKKICNGVFGSKKETPLMKKWLQKVEDEIENRKSLPWTALGSSILNSPHFLREMENYTILNGLDSVYPVNWNKCVQEFILSKPSNFKNLKRDFQPLLVLVNSVYRYFESYEEEEILSLDNPLSLFLREAMEKIENENN